MVSNAPKAFNPPTSPAAHVSNVAARPKLTVNLGQVLGQGLGIDFAGSLPVLLLPIPTSAVSPTRASLPNGSESQQFDLPSHGRG